MEKKCRKCQQTKALSEFYKDKSTGDGLTVWCKVCKRSATSAWRAANPDKVQEHQIKYAYPERVRKYNMQAKFGLSLADYETMLDRQGGGCAICGQTDPGLAKAKFLAVDHDHSCCPSVKTCGNCVRGLLCHPCNRLLGNVDDKVELLLNAAAYLLQSQNILEVI